MSDGDLKFVEPPVFPPIKFSNQSVNLTVYDIVFDIFNLNETTSKLFITLIFTIFLNFALIKLVWHLYGDSIVQTIGKNSALSANNEFVRSDSTSSIDCESWSPWKILKFIHIGYLITKLI